MKLINATILISSFFPAFIDCAFAMEKDIVFIKGHLFEGDCLEKRDLKKSDSICVYGEFINKTDKNICVKNSFAPSHGILLQNAFSLINIDSGDQVNYTSLQPGIIFGERRLAQLVRLIEPNAHLNFVVNLSKYYDIRKGDYTVTYKAPAQYCSSYDSQNMDVDLVMTANATLHID